MLGFQIAFDLPGDRGLPGEGAPSTSARDLGVARDHPRRRLRRHQRRRHQPDVRRRVHDARHASTCTRPRSPRTATTRSPPPAGTPRSPPRASATPARATRRPGSCASTASRSRCRWTPASGGAVTSSARCAPPSTPTARWSTSRRTRKGAGLTNHILRAEDVVDYATRGGAKALGLDSAIGSVEAGKKADLVLIKNDNSPVILPDPAPLRPRGVTRPGAATCTPCWSTARSSSTTTSWSAST